MGLDDVTGGQGVGEVWAVSGESGACAPLLALGMARTAAVRAGLPVLHLSTTSDPEQVHADLVVAQTGALAAAARRGVLDDESLALLAERTDALRQAPIEARRVSAADVVSAAEEALGGAAVDLLVVDAVQDVGDVPHLVRLARASGRRVIAVVPARGGGSAGPSLKSGVSLHVHVERPDGGDPDHPRCGEADLRVRRQADRRSRLVTVARQKQYRRFVDMAVDPVPRRRPPRPVPVPRQTGSQQARSQPTLW